MRDPNRIPQVLKAVGDLWRKHPDWRLGQLIYNAASYRMIHDLVNMEDDALLRGIAQMDKTIPEPVVLNEADLTDRLIAYRETLKSRLESVPFAYRAGIKFAINELDEAFPTFGFGKDKTE